MRGQKERMCVYVCCLVLYFVLGFTFIFESFARLLVSIANCVCISQSVSLFFGLVRALKKVAADINDIREMDGYGLL